VQRASRKRGLAAVLLAWLAVVALPGARFMPDVADAAERPSHRHAPLAADAEEPPCDDAPLGTPSCDGADSVCGHHCGALFPAPAVTALASVSMAPDALPAFDSSIRIRPPHPPPKA
jgi:hypothetical protein